MLCQTFMHGSGECGSLSVRMRLSAQMWKIVQTYIIWLQCNILYWCVRKSFIKDYKNVKYEDCCKTASQILVSFQVISDKKIGQFFMWVNPQYCILQICVCS